MGANIWGRFLVYRRFPTFDWAHAHNVHIFASPVNKRAYIMKLISEPDWTMNCCDMFGIGPRIRLAPRLYSTYNPHSK